MRKPPPSEEDLKELTRVVNVELFRVRSLLANARAAVAQVEQDSVMLLYKEGVPMDQMPGIVGFSLAKVYKLIPRGTDRRNEYPSGRHRSDVTGMNGGGPETPPG